MSVIFPPFLSGLAESDPGLFSTRVRTQRARTSNCRAQQRSTPGIKSFSPSPHVGFLPYVEKG